MKKYLVWLPAIGALFLDLETCSDGLGNNNYGVWIVYQIISSLTLISLLILKAL